MAVTTIGPRDDSGTNVESMNGFGRRGTTMVNFSAWLRRKRNFPELCARALGVTWALAMAWLLVVAARDHHPVFTSRLECGTDPRDILRPGETLEKSTLRFIVDAHCSNARYLPDDWIALRYVGVEVDVETRALTIGGQPYYQIVSVGGESAP